MSNNNNNKFCYGKMCHADNEKWEKRNSERNRTAKSRKHKDTWIERKLQVLRKLLWCREAKQSAFPCHSV